MVERWSSEPTVAGSSPVKGALQSFMSEALDINFWIRKTFLLVSKGTQTS